MADLWPHGLPADHMSDLGRAVARRYQQVGDRIEAKLRKLIAKGSSPEAIQDFTQRLRLARELEEYVQEQIRRVPPERLSEMVVSEASAGAAAATSRMLADVPGLDAFRNIRDTSATVGGLSAVTAIELDLRNAYTALNSRILRDSQDIFQEVTAKYASLVTAGVATRRELQKEILNEYLQHGVGSYVDAAGKNWPIDVYSEMATRTAASRAWRDQSVASMESHGIELFTPVAGRTACSICGPWQGKVVSRIHTGGSVVQVRDLRTGEPVQVTVDASLDEMRAKGWGHPNCRCILILYNPGSGISASDFTTRDPEAEADRAEERRLRRALRNTDDPARKRELRKDLRVVRDRIDSRKTNYATRPRGSTNSDVPTWKPEMTPKQADEWSKGSVLRQEFLHGTTRESAETIRDTGFNVGDSKFGRWQGNGVYLTENEGTALMYDRGETLTTRVNVESPLNINDVWTDPRFLEYLDKYDDTADAITAFANAHDYDSLIKLDAIGRIDELVVFDPKRVVVVKR